MQLGMIDGRQYFIFFGKLDSVGSGAPGTPLGFGACSLVKLQSRLTNTDGTANATNLFYGGRMVQPFELTPGTFSDWIPVSALSDIHVRSASTAQTVAFCAAIALDSVPQ